MAIRILLDGLILPPPQKKKMKWTFIIARESPFNVDTHDKIGDHVVCDVRDVSVSRDDRITEACTRAKLSPVIAKGNLLVRTISRSGGISLPSWKSSRPAALDDFPLQPTVLSSSE